MAVIGFFGAVHTDFHGTKKREPLGFPGFIGSVIVLVLSIAALYGAGAFEHLFSWS